MNRLLGTGVLGLLLMAVTAIAAPPLSGQDAAVLLSRYPAGSVPVDPMTMTAIHILAEDGTREEISLLRNLAENERDEVRQSAIDAIRRIRGRQRLAQREDFARSLPDWPELDEVSEPMRKAGLGPEEASCRAYSALVLGKKPHARPSFAQGDAQALLNVGRPRKAVAALIENPNQKARRLRAVAWEDLGEPRSAVLEYALLASRGDEASRFALDGYGIDAERLLLGLLSEPHPHLSAGSEAEILEVVVRHGDYLTTAVLSERLRSEVISDRATAADALVRMLDPSMRERTLHPFGVKIARHALVHASKDEVETIRLLAEEGL